MALYEIAVSRRATIDDTVNIVVRARSEKEARRKALRLAKTDEKTWFGPRDKGVDIGVDDSNKLDFEPGCKIY